MGRIKERYDFTLDSRQLGLVVLAGLVVAALMFVLGMSVGRQWERRLSADKGSQEDTQASLALAAPEDELPAAPPVKPAETLNAVDEEPAAGRDKPATADARKDEPEVIAPEDLTFPKVLSTNNAPAEKPAPKTKTAKPVKKTASSGKYTVQVGAFRDKASANRLAEKLSKKGYDSDVFSPSGPGGMYRVHIGGYGNRSDAQKMADRLKSKEGLKPYVTSYK